MVQNLPQPFAETHRTSNKILPLSKFNSPLKLDIGAGSPEHHSGEDFTTVDYYVDPDIKAKLWDIDIPSESVDEIWASHVLEHIQYSQVNPTLKEWLRLLKVGSRAIIQVRNFDYVARYRFIGENRAWAEQMVFGLQTHEGEFHRCAFTAS